MSTLCIYLYLCVIETKKDSLRDKGVECSLVILISLSQSERGQRISK